MAKNQGGGVPSGNQMPAANSPGGGAGSGEMAGGNQMPNPDTSAGKGRPTATSGKRRETHSPATHGYHRTGNAK